MRIAVTGTPGTGKTTATERLETDLEVIHLNDVIKEEGLSAGTDEQRDSLIADIESVERFLDGLDDVVIESHLAHHLDVDAVIVLRCHPETIENRLTGRGESADSARENAESEALDVILAEAVETYGRESVYEIETTDRTPPQIARTIEAVIAGDREPSVGTVDYTSYL